MQKERPLSPHLQVYRPQLTSMLSVLHRGTGIVLALGTPFLVYWLATIAAGPTAFAELQQCLSYWIVKLAIADGPLRCFIIFAMEFDTCFGMWVKGMNWIACTVQVGSY